MMSLKLTPPSLTIGDHTNKYQGLKHQNKEVAFFQVKARLL